MSLGSLRDSTGFYSSTGTRSTPGTQESQMPSAVPSGAVKGKGHRVTFCLCASQRSSMRSKLLFTDAEAAVLLNCTSPGDYKINQ